MGRITNIDVTVHPQHIAHVTLQVVLQQRVLIEGILPLVLALAEHILVEEKQSPTDQFAESVKHSILELKGWLAQYGDLTILPDQDISSAVPPTP